MFDQNKWSLQKVLMIVITCLFIASRLLNIIFMVETTGHPILGPMLILLVFQVAFLVILIVIPRKYRILAIIPLLYLITCNTLELISFINIMNSFPFPLVYIIENISDLIVSIITFTVYIILLLPMIQYQRKHILIATVFIYLFLLIYFVNTFQNILQIQYSILIHVFRIVVLNIIVSLSIPVVFTLYVTDDYKKQAENQLTSL